jgi:amidase
MARFVEDLGLILKLIVGVDWQDFSVVPMPWREPQTVDLKRLRVAFYTDDGINSASQETITVVVSAARAVSEAVMTVTEARPEGIEQTNELRSALLGADGGSRIQDLAEMVGIKEMHPLLQRRQTRFRSKMLSAAEFMLVLERWDRFRSVMLSFFQEHDVILCPVSSYPAFFHGASLDDAIYNSFSYTRTYNLTGWPSVVVRAGTSAEGLPIGVQVVASPWREDVALSVAQYIEMTCGGWQRPPL